MLHSAMADNKLPAVELSISVIHLKPVSKPFRLPAWFLLPNGERVWVEKFEIVDDLRCFHSIDAEAELTEALARERGDLD